MSKKRLMLGGHEQTREYQRMGFVVLDGNEASKPDIVATIPPLPKAVTRQKWDEITAIHFIEHLFREDALALVEELRDVLAPEGALILEQANIDYVMRVALGDIDPPLDRYPWMENDRRWCGIWNIYPQPHMIGGNDLNTHRYGYSPDTLRELLIEAGFHPSRITNQRATTHVMERDFRMVARL